MERVLSPDQAAGSGERELHKLLQFVVRSLVDNPGDVDVDLVSEPDRAVFYVEVNPADVGRLIGKNGQTVRALRVIVNAAGVKNGRRFEIEVDRSDNGE